MTYLNLWANILVDHFTLCKCCDNLHHPKYWVIFWRNICLPIVLIVPLHSWHDCTVEICNLPSNYLPRKKVDLFCLATLLFVVLGSEEWGEVFWLTVHMTCCWLLMCYTVMSTEDSTQQCVVGFIWCVGVRKRDWKKAMNRFELFSVFHP